MNNVDIVSSEKVSARDPYARMVLSLLSRFKRGRLEIQMPSGEQMSIGESDEILCRLTIRSSKFFKRLVMFGDVGFGESFVEREWESPNVTDVLRWMILNWEANPAISGSKTSALFLGLLRGFNRFQHLLRANDLKGAVKNISAHYDLSNRLFESFLDSSMTYSCADFSTGAQTLEEAQVAKFHRLAKAAQIRASDRVLEIGGGWGGFAIYLAKTHGCYVQSITVSKNQFETFSQRIIQEKLQDRVQVQLLDYRKLEGSFDKVVSIEMLEAVGHKYIPSFFETVERVLKPNGLLAVQVITCADSRYEKVRKGIDWIQKHIFPGSLLPSIAALVEGARKRSDLQIHSLHQMGDQYVRTLQEWRSRFEIARSDLRSQGFDDRFARSWNYYLSYCEAAFWMRHIGVAQIVFTRPNNMELSRETLT